MRKRTKSIQSNLFLTYSLIIIMVLAVFVSFFYFWVSNLLKDKAFQAISNLSASTSEKLDIEIQKMDYVSMNVLYSSTVKDRFITYINEPNNTTNALSDENQEKAASTKNTKELIDVLFAIIGPNRPVQQIYLYGFNGKVFGTGTDNRQQHISLEEKPWFNEVMNYGGKKYITIPMKDEELSKFATQSGSPYFISLCRMYFDNYNTPQGIVEVKQYYSEIFKNIAGNVQNSADEARIYVYDKNGSIIYPLIENNSEKDSYYFNLVNSIPDRTSSITANNPFSNERELLNYKYSDYTGWTTVVVISESKLLSPVFDFTRVLVLVAVVILLLALVFSFFAAKKITVPIARLGKAIKAFNLESPVASEPAELNTNLSELEDLNRAFHTMNIKLKKSHEELMLSHQHEMQARMLALQSQMNPHFLYNTLATISIMAEESISEQIVELCGNVSDMLRYISSDRSPLVKLSTEIEYTEKYLSCMKFRHGSKLSYSIEIDEEMKDIKIPKLVIQPLVENALKYATHKEPPWNIRICGHKGETYWKVSVEDDGTGFDPERLKTINERIEEIERSGLLPSLELEGMGLLNIFMRLKLSYRDKMIFQVGNNINGGAVVIVGGSI
ncbi:MAG: sensor histidine kinase [Bacillota bacterium]